MSVGGIIVCSERGAFSSFCFCGWILVSWINKNKPPQLLLFLFTFWLLIRFTADGFCSLDVKWNRRISDALQWNSHPLLHLRPSSSNYSQCLLINPSFWLTSEIHLSDHSLWSTYCSVSLWIFILLLILSTWSQTWYLSEERNSRW